MNENAFSYFHVYPYSILCYIHRYINYNIIKFLHVQLFYNLVLELYIFCFIYCILDPPDLFFLIPRFLFFCMHNYGSTAEMSAVAEDHQNRLARIRQTFCAGKSRSYEWRYSQIQLLERLIRDNGDAVAI
jgi:hypothetical protein